MVAQIGEETFNDALDAAGEAAVARMEAAERPAEVDDSPEPVQDHDDGEADASYDNETNTPSGLESRPDEVEEPKAEAPQKAAEADDPMTALDRRIEELAVRDKERLEKLHAERTQATERDREVHREAPEPARPTVDTTNVYDSEALDPDLMSETERALHSLLTNERAARSELEKKFGQVFKHYEGEVEQRRQAETQRIIDGVLDSAVEHSKAYPQVFGEKAPKALRDMAARTVKTRLLYETNESPELVVARVAKEFHAIRGEYVNDYVRGKLKQGKTRTNKRGGGAPASSKQKSPQTWDEALNASMRRMRDLG